MDSVISKLRHKMWKKCSAYYDSPWSAVGQWFPLFARLRIYKLRWIWNDFLAGIIVACFHIPQSMGTGMASNLGPIYGIYMTFFPGVIYAFLGSSHHNSLGAFPPQAALTGVAIARIRHMGQNHGLLNSTGELVSPHQLRYVVSLEHLHTAASIACVAGIVQIIMSVFQLGFISRMFSHNVLDPFNCACSLQIMLTQIPNMLGVTLPAYYGLNKHIMVLVLLFSNITSIRWGDTLFAMLSASTIIGFREFIQPVLFRHVKIAIPTEFIIMVIGTMLCYFFDLNGNYGITILGDMPFGIPYPSVPTFQNLPYPLLEGFLAALVSIAFVMQAAKVLARKGQYNVSSNKELAAVGCANFFGSFFSCFPSSVAVGRNTIQESMGSQSQLATVFGCVLTGLLLAFASQTLFYCPFSVIATIITLTLAMSLKMFGDLPRLYRSSKLDTVEWLLTFVACCLLDVEWGLLLGLAFSWFCVVYRSQRPRLVVLGRRVDYDALYVSLKHKGQECSVVEIPGIRIVQILSNSLHFANAEHFLRRVTKLTSINAQHNRDNLIGRMDGRKSRTKVTNGVATVEHLMQISLQDNPANNPSYYASEQSVTAPSSSSEGNETVAVAQEISSVVLDLTNVSSIDSTGLRALEQLASDLKKTDKQLWISRCRLRHIKKFEKYGLFKFIPKDHIVPEIHDAVMALCRPAPPDEVQTVEEEQQPDQTFWDVAGAPVEGLEFGDTS